MEPFQSVGLMWVLLIHSKSIYGIKKPLTISQEKSHSICKMFQFDKQLKQLF